MAFFENLGATITSKSKDVAKKAKELAEVASLNGQISTQEDNINRAFTEMGKVLYEKCKERPDAQWEEQCAHVDAAYAEIARLKAEILKVKGVKQCAQCGVEVQNGAAFCPSCGAKMPEDAPQETAEQASEAPQTPADSEIFETVEDPQVVETVEPETEPEKAAPEAAAPETDGTNAPQ